MTSYPGSGPIEPTNEPVAPVGETPVASEPTAPISSAAAPEMGYWEKQAAESSNVNPWGAPEPGAVPPAPPTTQMPAPAMPGAPTAYPPAYPPAQNPYASSYALVPDHPSATTALVLGLIGLIGGIMCALPLLFAPFAWVTGSKVVREVDASNGQLGGRGNGQAGMILGIIGTALLVLGLMALIAMFIFVGAASSSQG